METGDYVLVTTAHRGVFAGELVLLDEQASKVVLRNARCAIRWATSGGFLELAQDGPNGDSKIGSTAPHVVLYSITSVARCTEKARIAWQEHK